MYCRGPVFWFSTHGSELAKKKGTFLIPTATQFEEEGVFFNLEYRPQKNLKTLSVINDTRSIKNVMKALTFVEENSEKEFFSDYTKELIANSKLFSSLKNKILTGKPTKELSEVQTCLMSLHPFKSTVENFYVTNKFTKHSLTMMDCSKETIKKATNF